MLMVCWKVNLWPFHNVSEELIFWIFKMQSTKEELKTYKLISSLDDVNVLRNIFNVNTFYRELGIQ